MEVITWAYNESAYYPCCCPLKSMLCIMLPCLQRKTGHQMFSRGEEIKVVDANSRGFIGLILHISLTEGNTKKKRKKKILKMLTSKSNLMKSELRDPIDG